MRKGMRRSDPHAGLLRQLRTKMEASGMVATLELTLAAPWASATFTGMQHRFRFHIPDAGAEQLLENLLESEFALPDHLVADIALLQADAPHFEIEALTIEMA